jgi:hypothetical protein
MLGAFTNELDRIAPKFEIHGSQIQILRSPTEFYETLKVRYIGDIMDGYELMEVGQDFESRKSDIPLYFVHRENRA